jgi:hypothetical protein
MPPLPPEQSASGAAGSRPDSDLPLLPHMIPPQAPTAPPTAPPQPPPSAAQPQGSDQANPDIGVTAPRPVGQRVRPARKPNLAALSPAVAASLEKLAGGVARTRAELPAAPPSAEPAAEPVQGSKPRSDAAE